MNPCTHKPTQEIYIHIMGQKNKDTIHKLATVLYKNGSGSVREHKGYSVVAKNDQVSLWCYVGREDSL